MKRKTINFLENLFVVLTCLDILVGVIALLMGEFFLLLVCFLLFFLIAVIGSKLTMKLTPEEETLQKKQREQDELEYQSQITQVGNHYRTIKSSIMSNNPKIVNFSHLDYPTYIWENDNSLMMLPNLSNDYIEELCILGQMDTAECCSNIMITTTPLDEIEYFTQDGELYREQVISGGGGGGSSLGGAILGGLIAGEAGAVVGSRKQTEAIKSETITHDTRHTILKLKSRSIEMDTNAFEVLNELIPEKEYSIVQELRKQNIIASQLQLQGLIQEQISPSQVQLQTTVSVSIATQIEELAGLRDRGILTEEEFNEKKKVLLDRM